MDSLRMLAGMVLAISVFLLVEAWIREHQAPPAVNRGPATTGAETQIAPPAPTVGLNPNAKATLQGTPAALGKAPEGEPISVATDLLAAEIDTVGGALRRVELKKYSDTFDQSKNFVLLEQSAEHVYVAQSGLIGDQLPNHNSVFKATQARYELAPGQNELVVQLEAPVSADAVVTKTYIFHRGSYVIDVAFDVKNIGHEALEPYAYYQLLRDANRAPGESKMVPTFSGVEVYTDKDKLHKMSFEDIAKNKASYPKTASDGWIAVVQHYFLAAWLPNADVKREFVARALDNGLVASGVIVPMGRLEPGQSVSNSTRLYVGPQEQELLKTLAPGLEYTIDYGWLRVLAVPLFWVLNEIHSVVKNWGIAIIVLTVLIKVLFYPLSATSYKSMARMKVLAPKLQKLKERYGDDRQKMHQAMVELYKTEKINPLGGCLPIVVQIPVFIALYWTLLLSVELRHAPFALWIHDLSRPDPYFILPVLMGATMFIQTWLNPTPPDPMQAKLMKVMPLAFSIFFFFFPSGLVLYWLVNNILSIAQQWRITQVLERAKTARGEA